MAVGINEGAVDGESMGALLGTKDGTAEGIADGTKLGENEGFPKEGAAMGVVVTLLRSMDEPCKYPGAALSIWTAYSPRIYNT